MSAETFLGRAGWSAAARQHLAGDASARSYQRLTLGRNQAVLMTAPTGDLPAFLRIGAHLAGLGLSSPAVLAADAPAGLALLEDLGDALFTTVLTGDPGAEEALYLAAADVLLHLQRAPAPPGLADLSAADWAASAMLAAQFYAGSAAAEAGLRDGLQSVLATLADAPRVLILRDYHAGNLIWMPGRIGLARVGLLDFQDAQLGQPAYDLVSLLQDARRDVAPQTEARVRAHFARGLGLDENAILAPYAALGTLRAMRILGIFARLAIAGGKPHYLDLAPRVWGHLCRNLDHPALAAFRPVCLAALPAPTPETLSRIQSRCP